MKAELCPKVTAGPRQWDRPPFPPASAKGIEMRVISQVTGKLIDYSRMDYQDQAHHARYKKYVEQNGLVCQECGGAGDYVADNFGGYSLYEVCGWCEGTGKVTRWMRGLWLRFRKMEARKS